MSIDRQQPLLIDHPETRNSLLIPARTGAIAGRSSITRGESDRGQKQKAQLSLRYRNKKRLPPRCDRKKKARAERRRKGIANERQHALGPLGAREIVINHGGQ